MITTPIETFGFVPGQTISDESFSEADILAAETLLAEEIASRRPELDLSRNSSLHDTVIRPKAIAYLLVRRMLESFRQTMSLKGIQDSPEVASGEVINAILSNFFMERDSGEFATGWLLITTSSNRTSVIQQATRFTSIDGYTYLSTARVAAVDGEPTSDQTRLYSSNNGTQWYYYVEVKAEVRGAAQNSPTSSGFVCDSPIPDLVYIATGRPFLGGRDGDSISSLSSSVIQSLSVRNLVSRASVASEIPRLVTGVIEAHAVGSRHPLMLRGKANILGIPVPGHVDVYVKSAREPAYRRTVVTATADGEGSWTAELGATGSVGVMDITTIRPEGSTSYGSYSITSKVRTFVTSIEDADGNMISPNLVTAVEDCAGSVYQRCSVVFSLSASDLSTLGITDDDDLSVEVESLVTEYIPETHAILTDGNVAPIGYDMLARPLVPCIVSFGTISVICDDPLDSAVAPAIKSSIAALVNATPPGSPLLMDGIVSAIRTVSGVRSVDLPMRIIGTVILPDESFTQYEMTSLGNLTISNDPARGIGKDNIAFMINADDININLTKWTT